MSKREKLRKKLQNNPKDATLQEITTLLGYFGFVLVRIVGSHHVFRLRIGDVEKSIVVPVHGRKVKFKYVKLVVNTVDEMFPQVMSDEDDDE